MSISQEDVILLAQECNLLILTEEFPKNFPAQQRLISRLMKFSEKLQEKFKTFRKFLENTENNSKFLWKSCKESGFLVRFYINSRKTYDDFK